MEDGLNGGDLLSVERSVKKVKRREERRRETGWGGKRRRERGGRETRRIRRRGQRRRNQGRDGREEFWHGKHIGEVRREERHKERMRTRRRRRSEARSTGKRHPLICFLEHKADEGLQGAMHEEERTAIIIEANVKSQ